LLTWKIGLIRPASCSFVGLLFFDNCTIVHSALLECTDVGKVTLVSETIDATEDICAVVWVELLFEYDVFLVCTEVALFVECVDTDVELMGIDDSGVLGATLVAMLLGSLDIACSRCSESVYEILLSSDTS
jgi:hypothetical protein